MNESNSLTPAQLLDRLRAKKMHLAVAESLTGGAIAAKLVEVPGASDVLLGAIVAYQSEVKHAIVGVSRGLLQQQGAVDPEVAAQMAIGVRQKLASACNMNEDEVIGLATTGVAGPTEQDGKPVGLCYVAVSAPAPMGDCVYEFQFSGSREDVRMAAVAAALDALGEQIS